MTNEFENLKGFESRYKITKMGEIYSCWYKKMMKIQTNDDGYKFVGLTNDDGKHKCFIHRLLAIQYIPNDENKAEVDHIDRNKQNNAIENLRWATHTENQNNKSTNLKELTEEQLEEHKLKLREYKRVWALNKGRENGRTEKKVFVETEEEKAARYKAYQTKYDEKKREEMTEEERAVINARRRENRDKEKDREYFQRDDVKERRNKMQQEKRRAASAKPK